MQLRAVHVIVLAVFTLLPSRLLGQQPSTGEKMGSTAGVIPIPPAAIGASGPVGLFSRLLASFSSGKVEVRTLLFLPGNRVVRTYPYGGGKEFDLSRCNPDMCGRYELIGNRMTLRWDNGRTDQWSYEVSGDTVDIDGDRYRPARPVPSGELVGSWADTPGNVYTFAANGTFSFGGLPGRYAVAGLALSLAFQDGSTRTRTLFAAGGGEPVGMLSIDGDAYVRRR